MRTIMNLDMGNILYTFIDLCFHFDSISHVGYSPKNSPMIFFLNLLMDKHNNSGYTSYNNNKQMNKYIE